MVAIVGFGRGMVCCHLTLLLYLLGNPKSKIRLIRQGLIKIQILTLKVKIKFGLLYIYSLNKFSAFC
jgi:hypothetical protein